MKRKEKNQPEQQETSTAKRNKKQVGNTRKQIRQNIRNVLSRSEDMEESLRHFLK